jgi:23S rRNA (pseudouridine1915-N3)-methyltransferase
MKVSLIAVGKTDFKWIEEGVALYENRIKHYFPFSINILKDLKNKKNLDVVAIKQQEGVLLLEQITTSDWVVLLDDKGTEHTSTQFAGFLQQKINCGVKRIVFVIGGAYGFSNEVYSRANDKLSLSKLTFSHQIVRTIFLEQLYRACTIMKGEPYHHE